MSVLRSAGHARNASGFTLIELMIALLLGLIVSGAAVALFITNKQTYVASESLARVQENARTAFELMARDVREAAGNVCGAALNNTVNVINAPTSSWYTDFAGGIRGYDGATAFPGAPFGTTTAQRVAGTDAIELKSAFSDGVTVEKHTPNSANFKVNTVNHNLNDGDIAMVCDANHAAIFQVTNAQPGTNVTVVHNTGNTATPGNCTKGLGSPLDCSSTTGTSYEFGCAFGGQNPAFDCSQPANQWTAILAKLKGSRWYIGNNARGGRSLYTSTLTNTGGALSAVNDEITEGVNDMTLEYLVEGGANYQPAAGIDWTKVIAIRINLDMTGKEKIGTDGNVLQRDLQHVVTIRNRAP